MSPTGCMPCEHPQPTGEVGSQDTPARVIGGRERGASASWVGVQGLELNPLWAANVLP